MVKVIVVFHKSEVAKSIKTLLIRNGIDVLSVCTTGAQVAAIVDDLDEGLVISGYQFVDMMHMELNDLLPDTFDMLLIASRTQWEECTHAEIACLPMPLKSADFIRVAQSMLDEIARKRRRRRSQPKTRNPEEKAVIEHAKFMLMKHKNFSEEEAHRYIQNLSMNSGTSMVETAQMIMNFY